MSFFLALLGEFARDRPSRYGMGKGVKTQGVTAVREGQALALRHGEMPPSVGRGPVPRRAYLQEEFYAV